MLMRNKDTDQDVQKKSTHGYIYVLYGKLLKLYFGAFLSFHCMHTVLECIKMSYNQDLRIQLNQVIIFCPAKMADYHLYDIRCQAIHSLGLCLPRPVEWISTVEQCGVLGILCHTGSSLQEGLSALRINRVCPSVHLFVCALGGTSP